MRTLRFATLIAAVASAQAVDTTPPRITSFAIAPVTASTVATATSITIGFSEPIDPSSISSGSVQLIRSGGDGIFGNANDVAIPVTATLISADHLVIGLGGLSLPDDAYRVRLVATPGGSALHFDGSGQTATMLNTAVLNPTAAFTLECWFRFEAGGNWNPRMIERDIYNVGTTGLAASRAIGVGWGLNGTILFPENTWHHAAVTGINGGQWVLYVDGQVQSTIPNQAYSPSSLPLRLGRSRNVGYDQYAGTLDEIRVWSIARTQSDIQSTMNVALRGNEPGLIGYWRCDEGSGQTASDATGNGTDCYLGDTSAVEANDATWTTSGAPLTGIRDLAGNLLDGEVAGANPGALPSGDGVAGGDGYLQFVIDSSIACGTGSGATATSTSSSASSTGATAAPTGLAERPTKHCGLGGSATGALALALVLRRRSRRS
jgi:hypothetical protein